MELEVIVIRNITRYERDIIPRTALRGLVDRAGKSDTNRYTQRWLGEDMRRWKFVYFTESDLILHARPSVMKALKERLVEGFVLFGHRFQPIPRQDNFELPPEMDPLSESPVWCDAGKYYPSNPNFTIPSNSKACKATGAYCWACGFRHKNDNYSELEMARELHARIRDSPLIRIRMVCHFRSWIFTSELASVGQTGAVLITMTLLSETCDCDY
jgi:hypothetical protein